MRKRLTKDQILTIPNAMSLFRLLLIPFIVMHYIRGERYPAVALLLLSAATDICDGMVARKLNMVSDLGKVLDPLADKLTHAALLVCLMASYSGIIYIFVLLVIKECTSLITGGLVLRKKDTVHSASWHGKLCTVVFETTMTVLMLFSPKESVANVLLYICAGVMVFSCAMYTVSRVRIILDK